MPILKSPAKRMRSDAKKGARNLTVRTSLKTAYKRLVVLVGKKSKDAKKKAEELVSLYDRAASHGIIPKGRANRKKARIAKLVAKSPKK